jgi:hypothetical protein
MRNKILGLLLAFSLISVGYAAYQPPDVAVSYANEELNANYYLKVVPVPVVMPEMYCIENVEMVATVEVEPVTLFEIASTESLKTALFEEERFYAFVEDTPKQVPIYITNNNDAGYTRIITSSYGGPGLSCS